ncbi:hypothetical protein Bhyg_01369 [Pseudolycoriella hygida]|uniref:Uncharacterized protein n=1 Tax=Pseudolycoriella hygida TaxID=35572 RepID=A0A9Q0N9E1_9DIPT|nr:hypothetical protein Bhyg_01369 [Pseudolycoriella hygida]
MRSKSKVSIKRQWGISNNISKSCNFKDDVAPEGARSAKC